MGASASSSRRSPERPDRTNTRRSGGRSSRSAASTQAYKREVGVEADLTVAPISAAQCPALDLVRLAPPDGQTAAPADVEDL